MMVFMNNHEHMGIVYVIRICINTLSTNENESKIQNALNSKLVHFFVK